MNNNIIGSCVKLFFYYNIDSIKMIIIATSLNYYFLKI